MNRTLESKPQEASPLLWAASLLLVAGLTLTAHWTALTAKGLWFDDNQYMTESPLVLHPSWASTWTFFSQILNPTAIHGYYQPLTPFSLMIDVALGATPQDFTQVHRTSLLFHVLNAVLVVIVVYSILKLALERRAADLPPSERPATPSISTLLLTATLAGLVFGLHPLTVESTPWIAERKTLLATFFALLSLIAYLRFVRSPSRGAYVTCAVTFIFALLAKPTVTMLPAVMLAIDFWPLRRVQGPGLKSFATNALALIIEKWPLFVIAALSAVVTMISQARTAIISVPHRAHLVAPVLLGHNISFYAWKFFWPTHLSPWYVGPVEISWHDAQLRATVIGTIAILLVLLLSLRWTRAVVGAWLIWLIAILPTIGIIGFTGVIASDKYMYFPMIGFLLGLSWGFVWLWTWLKRRHAPVARWITLVVIGVILAIELRQTRYTMQKWQTTETLYAEALREQPRAGIVHNNYGNLLLEEGRDEEARKEYVLAIQYNPDFEKAYQNLGALRLKYGQLNEAVQLLQMALDRQPDYYDALLNMGSAYLKLGQYEKALEVCQRLLRYYPNSPTAYHDNAVVLEKLGRLDEAFTYEQKCLSLDPDYLDARLEMAKIRSAQGKKAEAVSELEEAIRRHPTSEAAVFQLADLLMELGRPAEAEKQYRLALQLDPNWPLAHSSLAAALIAQSRPEESIQEAREAIRLDPEFANGHFNLGTILLMSKRPAEAVPELEAALKLRKDFAKGHHYLGSAYEQLDRPADAIAEYRAALAIEPDNRAIRASLDAILAKHQNAADTRPESRPWTQPSK